MAENLQAIVDQVRAQTAVPGLVCGVTVDGVRAIAASGTARLSTMAPMLPDTLWIAGSITKLWTTSLAMVAVENGAIALDDRVIDHLPKFAVGDDAVTSEVRIRHLLNHSSGWDSGDFFTDDPRDLYIGKLRGAQQVHSLGAASSYNNAGFVVLDAILEHVTGTNFDNQVQRELIEPLGLSRTMFTEQATADINHAAGSLLGADGQYAETQRLLYPQAMRGAGTNLWASVGDMLTFFEMHLHAGRASDGTPILSQDSVDAMQTPTSWLYPGKSSDATDAGLRQAYCLGWKREFLHRGDVAYAHGGGSMGGVAQGGIVPSRGLAWVAFTNAWDLEPLLRLQAHVYDEDFIEETIPSADDTHLEPMLGIYRRAGYRYEVRRGSAPGEVELAVTSIPGEFLEVPGVPAEYVRKGSVISSNSILMDGVGETLVEFHEPDADGRYDAMFESRRVSRRAR